MTQLARASIETECGEPAAFKGRKRADLLNRIISVVSRRNLGFVTAWEIAETVGADRNRPSDEELMAESR